MYIYQYHLIFDVLADNAVLNITMAMQMKEKKNVVKIEKLCKNIKYSLRYTFCHCISNELKRIERKNK